MNKIKMTCAIILAVTLCFAVAWIEESFHQHVVASTSPSMISIDENEASDSNVQKPSIVLDAGHGGYDSGSIGEDGSLEKDITLSITLKLGELLQEKGYTIIYIREQDEVPWESDNIADLHARVDIANQVNADYYISLHTNFSEYNDGAYGFETYLDYENQTIIDMAYAIHDELNVLNYTIDRGLKSTMDSPLYVIDQNEVPALLLELGFLSDEDDAYALLHQQDALAQAIADGIDKIFP